MLLQEKFDKAIAEVADKHVADEVRNFFNCNEGAKECIGKIPVHDVSGDFFKSGLIGDVNAAALKNIQRGQSFVHTDEMLHLIAHRSNATIDRYPNHRVAHWINANVCRLKYSYRNLGFPSNEAREHIDKVFRQVSENHPLPMLADYLWSDDRLQKDFSKTNRQRLLKFFGCFNLTK